MNQLTTLCYIEKNDAYLMMHRTKKENDMNKEKWIGIGGHFEDAESPEECLLREVYEETGLTLTDYRLRGIITFVLNDTITEYMFLYTATGFTGDLKDCDEGELEWVKKTRLKELNLWEGDYVFFDLMDKDEEFFSLKLCYKGSTLTDVWKNGEKYVYGKK